MKKLSTMLLFALLSVGATVYAQDDLYFTYKGEKLEDGATLEIGAVREETDLDDGDFWVTVEAGTNMHGHDLMLKNATDADITLNGTVTVISNNAEDSKPQWCAFGNCTPAINGRIEKKNANLLAGAEETMQVDVSFEENNFGLVETKLTLVAGLTRMTLNINFTYESNGIQSEKFNTGSTKLINNELIYSFDQPAKRQLNVYSVTGTLIRNYSLGQSGAASLRDLSKGVYIYEVIENGKRVATRKCVIE